MADLVDVAEPILDDVNEADLVVLANNMYFGCPSFRPVYQPPKYSDECYILLQPRLDKYGRAITKMHGDGSCYWRSFSHQCWHTQEYHLFARFATAAYMRKHRKSYASVLYKKEPANHLPDQLNAMDKIVTEGLYKGKYPGASEIQQLASCELFGVKIECLRAFGDEVISELCPRSDKFHKEIRICYIPQHADSMFLKDSVVPDVASLKDDRIKAIRQTGCFTPQDFMGCLEFPC